MRLSNSTQPTSTSRGPARDQGRWFRYRGRFRAFVFQRQNHRLPFRHFSDRRKNFTHLRARGVESFRGIHDEIGARALFGIRHLLGEDGGEFLLGHPGPLERPRALHVRRRRHHDHGVAAASPPVSNSSGISSTATWAPLRSASARNRRAPRRPADARSIRAS